MGVGLSGTGKVGRERFFLGMAASFNLLLSGFGSLLSQFGPGGLHLCVRLSGNGAVLRRGLGRGSRGTLDDFHLTDGRLRIAGDGGRVYRNLPTNGILLAIRAALKFERGLSGVWCAGAGMSFFVLTDFLVAGLQLLNLLFFLGRQFA